jgi:NADPH-dependent 2,4-dienoyl-CoA reductase/sulfur reductase-like enzyme
MVGMTRAHIADPHIVKKIMEGRENEIRPCVGATYCLDRIYEGHEALCIHNPATGREATMPQAIARTSGPRKTVVVVGAGPGGLEAARVAAERGHKVTLIEASPRAGGQIALATRAKRRAEIVGIVDWRVDRLEKLGVETRYSTLADADLVTSLAPDVVIVATGGMPGVTRPVAGQELAVSSWDILSGDVKPADEVLLFDDNGAHPGLAAAEFLIDAGSKLELVTPERFFAPEMGGLNLVPYVQKLHGAGAVITTMARVGELKRVGNRIKATLWSPYTEKPFAEREVDQVVFEQTTLPNADLYFELKPLSSNRGEVDYEALVRGAPQAVRSNPSGRFQLFRIGDAVASRNIHAAIYDAARLCKDL